MGKSGGGTSGSKGGSSGGGGGGSTGGTVSNYTTTDASEAEFSSLSGKLSVWKDLEDSIKQMLSPEGRVTVSQATTTVMVRDRPTNVNLIAQYIQNINKNLSRQVLVKVQILEVDLLNNFNFGINWGMIARAFNKSPFVLSANYGTPIVLQQTLSGAPIPIGGIKGCSEPSK